MLQNLAAHIPKLEKLLADIEEVSTNGVMYKDQPNIYDVDLPLICAYLTYWWQLGPDGTGKTRSLNSKFLNQNLIQEKGGKK